MLEALKERAVRALTRRGKDELLEKQAYLEGSVKYLAIDIYEGKITQDNDAGKVWELLREYGEVAAEQERRDQQRYGR
jgi:hypothetical protein